MPPSQYSKALYGGLSFIRAHALSHTSGWLLPGPLGVISVFSILPKDTSTCGQLEPGFALPTLQLLDGSLNQLATAAVICTIIAFAYVFQLVFSI